MKVGKDSIRDTIHSSLHIRWFLLCAWLSCLFGLLFAILPLAVNDAPGGMSIFVFNTSSLGLAAYNDSSRPNELYENLHIMVDPPIDNPASITQYLGVHDWYTVSYLWTCRGWYENVNGTLGRKMVNSTCKARGPLKNTKVSLLGLVQPEMDLRAERLLEDLPVVEYQPILWFYLWLGGICFAAIVFLILPFTFDRRRLLGVKHWSLIPVSLSLIPASIFIATLTIIKRAGSDGEFQATLPDRFRHLSNLAITCMFSTFSIGSVGWLVGTWLKDSLPTETATRETSAEQYSDDRPVAQTDGLNELEPRPMFDPLRSQPMSTMPLPPTSMMELERIMPTPVAEEEHPIEESGTPEARRKDAHSM